MYYKQIKWLESSVEDLELSRMLKLRADKRMEIYHLQYHRDRLGILYSSAEAALSKAIREHAKIDYDLAFIDGRYAFLETPKPKKRKARKKKDPTLEEVVKKMSKVERLKFIEELEKMKV